MFIKNVEKKNKNIKQIINRAEDIRIHLNNMEEGKRILLRDGRIGIFRGYNGTALSGESFMFEFNGSVQEVQLEEYDCVLIDNSSITCPVCKGERIMDGYIGNPDGTLCLFRENINNSTGPSFNSRRIRTHACRNCGYIMSFVDVLS